MKKWFYLTHSSEIKLIEMRMLAVSLLSFCDLSQIGLTKFITTFPFKGNISVSRTAYASGSYVTINAQVSTFLNLSYVFKFLYIFLL